jgi:hypothetical protein
MQSLPSALAIIVVPEALPALEPVTVACFSSPLPKRTVTDWPEPIVPPGPDVIPETWPLPAVIEVETPPPSLDADDRPVVAPVI